MTGYSPLGNLNPAYRPTPPHHSSSEASHKNEEYPHPSDLPTILSDATISSIAAKRGCTNAQVALSWGMGRGTSVIPKANTPHHIHENVKAVECYLHEDDYDEIEAIEERYVKRFNKQGKGWGLQLFQGLDDPDDCRYD